MFFQIDPDSGVAIYDQIARQVKYAIARNTLRAGELVPSVRELAVKLAVNPNTVARAYRDLQNDRVLEALRGEGLRVSQEAAAHCRRARQANMEERVQRVVIEALQSGFAKDDFVKIVESAWQSLARSKIIEKQSIPETP
ncbi:MAG: GntR family transcriptional regulator [Planctomycetaceae bacterium]